MTEATISPENRQDNRRLWLRYGGWTLLVGLVAWLFLAPARPGRVPEEAVQQSVIEEPVVPAARVADTKQPADPNTFTAESMGDAWPFTGISRATVECRKGQYAVVVADNGTTYALDGSANIAARTGKEDFIRIDAIRRRIDEKSRTLVSLDPLIERASALCGN